MEYRWVGIGYWVGYGWVGEWVVGMGMSGWVDTGYGWVWVGGYRV
jgi:hypothetical protein